MGEEALSWNAFLDWYDVCAGYISYAEDSRQVSQEAPSGVRLAVQRPEKIGPFFRRERPWEALMLSYFSILHDGGRYRMWYSAYPDPEDPDLPSDHPLASSHCPEYVCYAESEDGVNWERPELGLCAYGGSTANNILFPAGYFGLNSLIRDPAAPEAEGYKSIDTDGEWRLDGRLVSNREVREFRRELWKGGDAAGEQASRLEVTYLLRGAVSPDGLRWTRLEEPLARDPGGFDTQNVIAYDAEANRYAAYVRGHIQGRRIVRRTVAAEFRGAWSEPQPVMMTDSHDAPHQDLYTAAYCRYPGGTHHLMFPSVFHRATDVLDIQLAVSRDGFNWSRPQRRPIIDRNLADAPAPSKFGMLFATPGLLPLGEERWGLGFTAYRRSHSQWDWEHYRPVGGPDGEYWWAVWPPHRLMALEAPAAAHLTLTERRCTGKQLLANFRTEPGGWIQFELARHAARSTDVDTAPPLPGHSFSQCDPLRGDSLAQPVTWAGSSDLSSLKGVNIAVRVRMFRTKLFAIAM